MKPIVSTIILALLLLCSCGGREMTAELAYEGVANYCKSEFDWSPAEGNPEIMYVKMGEETETEYEVIFRSDAGTIDLFDYIR